NRILTDILAGLWIIISEPVVIQTRFAVLILPRKTEWAKISFSAQLPQIAPDVYLAGPDLLAVLVEDDTRSAEVVGDYRVVLIAHKFGHGRGTVRLKKPGSRVVDVTFFKGGRALGFDSLQQLLALGCADIFGKLLPRQNLGCTEVSGKVFNPFVKWVVAVPYPTGNFIIKCFANAAA